MDLHSIPEIKIVNMYHWTLSPHSQMLSQMYQKQKILHQNPWQQIGCKLSCRCRKWPLLQKIAKWLLTGKAPQHKTDLFTHVRGLLYKHIIDSGQKFLALVIPNSWKYTVLVKAHDKLGHHGNTHTYCLIKHQGSTSPTSLSVTDKKPKSRPTHFKWQRSQTDHSTKLP